MPDASATPWLDEMRQRLGVSEIVGKKNNPAVLAMFADVGHTEVESEEVSWCAAATGSCLKSAGLPIPPKNVNRLARSYLSYGTKCEAKPGAIAVWPRGNSSWQGHVNIVETVLPDGRIICIGGNQSDAVTRTKPMDPSGALGFRWPVKPVVAELRKAGSTEIKKGDAVQNSGTILVAIPPAVAAAKELLAPITTPPKMENIGEALTFWQQTIGGINAVGALVADNPWLAGTCIAGLMLAWLGHTIKKQRVARAAAGVPLSAELEPANV